jgi:hypothetical protein
MLPAVFQLSGHAGFILNTVFTYSPFRHVLTPLIVT